MKILVAEDDPVSRRVAQRLVELLGHDCEAVENGALAVDKASSGDFDAVLLDVHMPEMDGFEAAVRIRETGQSPAGGPPRIIVATADILETTRQQMEKNGADAQILKPIRVESLEQALHETVLALPLPDESVEDSEFDIGQFDAALDPTLPESLEIFADFRTSIREELQELETFVLEGKATEVAALGHRMRGTLSILGFRGAAQVVKELEDAASEERLAESPKSTQEISEVVDRALKWGTGRLEI